MRDAEKTSTVVVAVAVMKRHISSNSSSSGMFLQAAMMLPSPA
jgi:hypothetical protein